MSTELQAIIEIDDSVSFDNLHEDLQARFDLYQVRFVTMPSTKVVAGKRIILGHLAMPDGLTPMQFKTMADELVTAYGMTWNILALQDWNMHQSGEDDDGNPIMSLNVHIPVTQSFIDTYVVANPIVDINGNVTGTKPITKLSVYSGAADWVMP